MFKLFIDVILLCSFAVLKFKGRINNVVVTDKQNIYINIVIMKKPSL
jgi:hypothetical protein